MAKPEKSPYVAVVEFGSGYKKQTYDINSQQDVKDLFVQLKDGMLESFLIKRRQE